MMNHPSSVSVRLDSIITPAVGSFSVVGRCHSIHDPGIVYWISMIQPVSAIIGGFVFVSSNVKVYTSHCPLRSEASKTSSGGG